MTAGFHSDSVTPNGSDIGRKLRRLNLVKRTFRWVIQVQWHQGKLPDGLRDSQWDVHGQQIETSSSGDEDAAVGHTFAVA